jgi:hypothetical protein
LPGLRRRLVLENTEEIGVTGKILSAKELEK